MNTEADLIERIIKGEKQLYEGIIRKYNQRLYRIARSFIRNEDEIEDVMQETYIKAYLHLKQFEGKSQFSTWITRILINQANQSLNKEKRVRNYIAVSSDELPDTKFSNEPTPDQNLMNDEMKKYLEHAIDELPETLRSVYIMREVEGLSVNETSETLSLSIENVKTRLHRAKASLKDSLFEKGEIDLFHFKMDRCDRVVLAVMFQVDKTN
ncbi:MAG TPA: RNA polymerase sigma factor [Cytophagaceae bacterium]|jgi:RNA polymerase sigma-70 factor (ECF subfamily)|nr:RNA polymerase sigma factor [Cytophagaceae bacterium]